MNTVAADWLSNHYNFPGYPTLFYDGGDQVTVGAYSDSATNHNWFEPIIDDVADRVVEPLNVIISVDTSNAAANEFLFHVRVGNGVGVNSAPSNAAAPTGLTTVTVGASADYTTSATDPDGDGLYFQMDWGDGQITEWLGPFDEGVPHVFSHSWSAGGSYDIKVRTKDWYEEVTDWSSPLTVAAGCCLSPTVGDCDQSGVVDITDVSVLIDNQFLTLTPLSCEAEGDVDYSGVVDITDLSVLIDNQFLTLTPLNPCP
ncbi:MAG: hypothetical protein GY867_10985 [bacterium]|nr:hypothetical protein [bacterium]